MKEVLNKYDKIYVIKAPLTGAGFGAIILNVLSHLRYSKRANYYPVVNFDNSWDNPYADPSLHDNFWHHYFEPVMSYSSNDLKKYAAEINDSTADDSIFSMPYETFVELVEEHPDSVYSFTFGKWRFAKNLDLDEWYKEQRRKGRETVKEFIRPKAHIVDKVNSFYKQHLKGSFVLGLHVRGTDMNYGAVVAPAEYFKHIDSYIKQHADLKIFLATDQVQYLEVFQDKYGERVYYTNCLRSEDEIAPFKMENASPYQKGEEILLDILLLAKSDFLIKSASNVGEMAIYFSENLECLDLAYKKRYAYGEDYADNWDTNANTVAWKLMEGRKLDELSEDAHHYNKFFALKARVIRSYISLKRVGGKLKAKWLNI